MFGPAIYRDVCHMAIRQPIERLCELEKSKICTKSRIASPATWVCCDQHERLSVCHRGRNRQNNSVRMRHLRRHEDDPGIRQHFEPLSWVGRQKITFSTNWSHSHQVVLRMRGRDRDIVFMQSCAWTFSNAHEQKNLCSGEQRSQEILSYDVEGDHRC